MTRITLALLLMLVPLVTHGEERGFRFGVELYDRCRPATQKAPSYEPGAPMIDSQWIRIRDAYCFSRSEMNQMGAEAMRGDEHQSQFNFRLEPRDPLKSALYTLKYGATYNLDIYGGDCRARLKLRANLQMLMLSCKF